MTYDEALERINGLEGRAWRSGLDRMRELVRLADLGASLNARNYVHIAGTNGKGTTTAFVESILRHQGYRTGAFYSPFVVDYRERIQAEGAMISPEELVFLSERILPVADSMMHSSFGGASKFEVEAAMGLAYWEARDSEWVALEVGLGGRLDATNVIEPKACVIASIGLDHTALLGTTLREIAREKAGIIKPGVPVVLGEMPREAQETIFEIASAQGSPCWSPGRDYSARRTQHGFEVMTPTGRYESENPRLGGFPPVNAELAIAACAAAGALPVKADLSQGVSRAWLPGRWDWREVQGRPVLFDGAHNEDAARLLVRRLGDRPIRLVSNMLSGHEIEAFYRVFLGSAVSVEVAPIQATRALPPAETVDRLESLGMPAKAHRSVYKAVRAALEHDERVVVTGSNYLVGAALRLFGGMATSAD